MTQKSEQLDDRVTIIITMQSDQLILTHRQRMREWTARLNTAAIINTPATLQ